VTRRRCARSRIEDRGRNGRVRWPTATQSPVSSAAACRGARRGSRRDRLGAGTIGDASTAHPRRGSRANRKVDGQCRDTHVDLDISQVVATISAIVRRPAAIIPSRSQRMSSSASHVASRSSKHCTRSERSSAAERLAPRSAARSGSYPSGWNWRISPAAGPPKIRTWALDLFAICVTTCPVNSGAASSARESRHRSVARATRAAVDGSCGRRRWCRPASSGNGTDDFGSHFMRSLSLSAARVDGRGGDVAWGSATGRLGLPSRLPADLAVNHSPAGR
jgi:hypothetical protein